MSGIILRAGGPNGSAPSIYPFPCAGIFFWFAASDPPDGALVLDGSQPGRLAYPRLWAIAQVEFANGSDFYGPGDGSTTFTLLDQRGKYIRAGDLGAGIDPGRILGSYQSDAFQDHAHFFAATTNATSFSGSVYSAQGSGGTPSTVYTSVQNARSGNIAEETRTKNNAFLPCITY